MIVLFLRKEPVAQSRSSVAAMDNHTVFDKVAVILCRYEIVEGSDGELLSATGSTAALSSSHRHDGLATGG